MQYVCPFEKYELEIQQLRIMKNLVLGIKKKKMGMGRASWLKYVR